MSESQWVKHGGTLSHKNACKEFGLTEEEIFDAMKNNDLNEDTIIDTIIEYYGDSVCLIKED